MRGVRRCRTLAPVPEGLSAAEVGQEIAQHRRHAADHDPAARRGHWISIIEAVLLSVVAVFAAYSGYCAAKWGTEASVSLAKAAAARTKANRADLEALQIRTLDSVSFTPAFAALTSATRGPPAGRPAPAAGLPPRVPGLDGTAPADEPARGARPLLPAAVPHPAGRAGAGAGRGGGRAFPEGRRAGQTSDDYVRLTVLLATVFFLVGISSHFPVHLARYGLIGMALVRSSRRSSRLASLPGPAGPGARRGGRQPPRPAAHADRRHRTDLVLGGAQHDRVGLDLRDEPRSRS